MPALKILPLTLLLLLSGCNIPFLSEPKVDPAQLEADGKAIGSGCRHALRGPEECFSQNPTALKSAVFAGWKEMDQYMRDNKLDGQQPPAAAAAPKPDKAKADDEEEVVEDPKPKKSKGH